MSRFAETVIEVWLYSAGVGKDDGGEPILVRTDRLPEGPGWIYEVLKVSLKDLIESVKEQGFEGRGKETEQQVRARLPFRRLAKMRPGVRDCRIHASPKKL